MLFLFAVFYWTKGSYFSVFVLKVCVSVWCSQLDQTNKLSLWFWLHAKMSTQKYYDSSHCCRHIYTCCFNFLCFYSRSIYLFCLPNVQIYEEKKSWYFYSEMKNNIIFVAWMQSCYCYLFKNTCYCLMHVIQFSTSYFKCHFYYAIKLQKFLYIFWMCQVRRLNHIIFQNLVTSSIDKIKNNNFNLNPIHTNAAHFSIYSYLSFKVVFFIHFINK